VFRHAVVIVLGASFAVANFNAIAYADSVLSRALHHRKAYVHKLTEIQEDARLERLDLQHRLRALPLRIAKVRSNGPSIANYRLSWNNHLNFLLGVRRALRVRLHDADRYMKDRTEALRMRRSALSTWIQAFGMFRACPIRGDHVVANNFGYVVQKRLGVPRHIHLGNDITAAYGTPIVAPFDGTAVASTNTLGGLAVKVYGDSGYVYNAHLSSYGSLGTVTLGDVIGYVGDSGDALGSHDHFEWHPGNGPAVDPYPYLMAVC
jgi:murein DD-endopeptidase MepM/ murein hydrolase activator NlpD